MPTLDELRHRYREYSDVELAELSQAELTEDGRTALSEELAARSLTSADLPSTNTSARGWPHRGWITVFQALVIIGVALQSFNTLRAFLSIDAPLLVILPYLLAGEALSAIPVTGFVFIVRRSRFARPFWLWYLALTAAFIFYPALFTPGVFGAGVVARLAFVTGWFVYWQRSARVRSEFPPRRPNAKLEPEATPARDERSTSSPVATPVIDP